jgi:hypothetical protein
MLRTMILATAATVLFAAAGPAHKVSRDSAVLDFTYQWPADAAAIPTLDRHLYRDAKAKLADAAKLALEDSRLARGDKREFHRHDYSMSWSTAGRTARLIALEGDFEAFTGGAHPMHGNQALLWDRRKGTAIDIKALFLKSSALAAITRARYCAALDAERAKRRDGEKYGNEFDACPDYSDLAISPADKDRDGRFDTLDLVAPPYVAGPYVEGAYAVSLPVTSQLIAAIRPEFRSAFERHRQ